MKWNWTFGCSDRNSFTDAEQLDVEPARWNKLMEGWNSAVRDLTDAITRHLRRGLVQPTLLVTTADWVGVYFEGEGGPPKAENFHENQPSPSTRIKCRFSRESASGSNCPPACPRNRDRLTNRAWSVGAVEAASKPVSSGREPQMEWRFRSGTCQGNDRYKRTLRFVIGIRRNDDGRANRALHMPQDRIQVAPVNLPRTITTPPLRNHAQSLDPTVPSRPSASPLR